MLVGQNLGRWVSDVDLGGERKVRSHESWKRDTDNCMFPLVLKYHSVMKERHRQLYESWKRVRTPQVM